MSVGLKESPPGQLSVVGAWVLGLCDEDSLTILTLSQSLRFQACCVGSVLQI